MSDGSGMVLPKALLVDLDDTILDSDSNADAVWLEVCREFAGRHNARP